jgi:hypothetical protein
LVGRVSLSAFPVGVAGAVAETDFEGALDVQVGFGGVDVDTDISLGINVNAFVVSVACEVLGVGLEIAGKSGIGLGKSVDVLGLKKRAVQVIVLGIDVSVYV